MAMDDTDDDIKGVRLILSDGAIGGGQRVKTFSFKPVTVQDVLTLLTEHLGLNEVCGMHAIDPATLEREGSGLTLAGIDGPRKMPLKGDAGLVNFISTVQHTRLPSIEVSLTRKGPRVPDAKVTDFSGDVAERQKRGRQARDKVETLEDSHALLLKGIEKMTRRILELERLVRENKDEAARNLTLARKEIDASEEKIKKEMSVQVEKLKASDRSILADLDVVRKHSVHVEKEDIKHHEEMKQSLADLGERMQAKFDELDETIEELREVERELAAEDARQQEVLNSHGEELERLEGAKTDRTEWREEEEAMAERITKEVDRIHKRVDEVEEDLNAKIVEAKEIEQKDHAQICDRLEKHKIQTKEEFARVEGLLDDAIKKAEKELAEVQEEVLLDTKTKVDELTESTRERFEKTKEDIDKKNNAMNRRVDDLTANTEATFKVVNERTEEHLRVERIRFGTIERDLVDTNTKIRSDFRAEVDRVRADYEQEAERLHTDLNDLHQKHDVTKQEINFVQSKLMEQREWAQRQLTETATATRAVQVDAQEGLSATTKMLHALRDDAVGFREKMAKHVALLQRSADSQGDAITGLEQARGKIRADLDTLIDDHSAYTDDMDNWADDVRIKVEKLFRAMEPSKAEWRVHKAEKKAKTLLKPLAVKSPVFSLRGLREVQFELFPDGSNNSPDGKALLRVFLPAGVHIRYQIWLGYSTEGSKEHYPGGSLSADMFIDNWTSQIQEDGSVPVKFEVLRDFSNEDESLASEVRIETA